MPGRSEAESGLGIEESLSVGLDVSRFEGVQTQSDAGATPKTAFRQLINVRLRGGRITDRGGQSQSSVCPSGLDGMTDVGPYTPEHSMAIYAGDGQTASPGAAVAIAPAVRVLDDEGHAVENWPVTFSVTSGGGSITGASALTNSSGVATVGSWTLGASPGANTLKASAPAVSDVTFTATAAYSYSHLYMVSGMSLLRVNAGAGLSYLGSSAFTPLSIDLATGVVTELDAGVRRPANILNASSDVPAIELFGVAPGGETNLSPRAITDGTHLWLLGRSSKKILRAEVGPLGQKWFGFPVTIGDYRECWADGPGVLFMLGGMPYVVEYQTIGLDGQQNYYLLNDVTLTLKTTLQTYVDSTGETRYYPCWGEEFDGKVWGTGYHKLGDVYSYYLYSFDGTTIVATQIAESIVTESNPNYVLVNNQALYLGKPVPFNGYVYYLWVYPRLRTPPDPADPPYEWKLWLGRSDGTSHTHEYRDMGDFVGTNANVAAWDLFTDGTNLYLALTDGWLYVSDGTDTLTWVEVYPNPSSYEGEFTSPVVVY